MTEQKRVAIYARVSTTDQTPENQLLDLRAECAHRGWKVFKEFVDHGISGAKEERPALRELMEAVRKRKVDVVFVWRFDRFARSLTHLVSALEYFRERHIDFTSYSEGIDTATSHGKLVFSIFAAIAEFERALLIERIHSGLRRSRADGKRSGRPPISKDKVAEILALEGNASIREIAARTGISKSVVHKVLSLNGVENVALPIDEPPVTFGGVRK